MKNGCNMIIRNKSGFSSWKCGKDGAFTHIPTNLILLIKNTPGEILFKRRAKVFHGECRT